MIFSCFLFFTGMTISPQTSTQGSEGGIFQMAKQLGRHSLPGMRERLSLTTSAILPISKRKRSLRLKAELNQAQVTLTLLNRPLVLQVFWCLKLRMRCSEKKMTDWKKNWRNKSKHFHLVKSPPTPTESIVTLACQMLPQSSFWKPFFTDLISSITLIGMSSISCSSLWWSSDWIVVS